MEESHLIEIVLADRQHIVLHALRVNLALLDVTDRTVC